MVFLNISNMTKLSLKFIRSKYCLCFFAYIPTEFRLLLKCLLHICRKIKTEFFNLPRYSMNFLCDFVHGSNLGMFKALFSEKKITARIIHIKSRELNGRYHMKIHIINCVKAIKDYSLF